MKNAITLFLIFLTQITFAQSGTVDLTFNPSDIGYGNGVSGDTKLIQKVKRLSDGKILLVGIFDKFMGISANNIVRLNEDGTFDSTFNSGTGATGASNTIFSFALQSDGKIIIVGSFTTYNGTPRNCIARLNTDGSLDTTFDIGTGPGSNQEIEYIELQTNGQILIFGSFSSINGLTRKRIARLNSDGSLDTTFDTGVGPDSNAVIYTATEQDNGKILVTGNFLFYSNISRNGVALLNSDGTLDANSTLGIGPCNGIKKVIKLPSGKTLIAGGFTQYNETLINNIARLNSDGSIDSSFNIGSAASNMIIDMIVQPDGKILISGFFTLYNGVSRKGIARLNSDGTLDLSFNPGGGVFTPTNDIKTIEVVPNGKILVGGILRAYDNITRNYFAQLNADGTLDLAFTPGTAAGREIKTIAVQSDGKILIGGTFPSYNDVPRNGIARLLIDGTLDTTFTIGTGKEGNNSTINTVKVQADGKILVGGFFTSFNGNSIANLIRLNADGSLDTNFIIGTGTSSTTETIAIQADGKIIIGGLFTNINGTASTRIARLNSNGTVDNTFNIGSGTNNAVYALAIQSDGKILVGGLFTSFNGIAKNRLARLNNDGSLDTTFNTGTGPNTTIFTIVEQADGKILIGGNFTSFNDIPAVKVARLNSIGELDPSFFSATGANQPVRNIAETNIGKIIVGGQFGSYNGIPQKGLIQLNTDGSVDTSFEIGSGPDGLVNSLVIQNDGKLIIGGKFQSFNQIGRNNIARIQTAESSLSRLENQSHSITVFPNPTSGIIFFSNSNNEPIDKIEIIDILGKLVLLKLGNSSQIDMSEMVSGMYILRIYFGATIFQQKIIKY